MQPHRHDINIWQANTFEMPFALEEPDGTVTNLATAGDGYDTGWFVVKDTLDGDVQVEATTANGRLSLTAYTDADGNDWSGYVRIPASVTKDMTDFGDGSYDLQVSDGLRTYTVLYGTAVLTPEVSTT
jgi:hypothetical protein